MYIEMEKTNLDVSQLFTAVQRRRIGDISFPYKSFVCRCRNCRYSSDGKCNLQRCCCLDERIRANTCSFDEIMRQCFTEIGDNVFRYRLHIAIDRAIEKQSCFLNSGHRRRFYDGLSRTGKADGILIAQIFLLSAFDELWREARKVIEQNCIVFSALEIGAEGIDLNAYKLLLAAWDLEYGSTHLNYLDLSDEETLDFDVFRVICYAAAISAYGLDVIKISEKQRKRKETAHNG